MLYILIAYLIIAFVVFIIPKKVGKYYPFVLAFAQLGAFVFFFLKLPDIRQGNTIIEVYNWIPQLGLNFEFILGGLSMAFALLITGIGSLVFLYAYAYMYNERNNKLFYFYFFLFSGAMLGLVLSGNLIQLFVFWELTSYLSYLLISFNNEQEPARKAAFQSLYTTAFGGLVLLAGVLLLGSVVDSYSVSEWVENADAIKESKYYVPGLLFILVGAFSKSAQFPFHFWLPGAMQAPAPVSSYLHSATMVKAGIFVMALLSPVLGGTILWTYLIPLVGVITMLIGSYFALTQTNLKAILAYTTISALGILTLLIGIDTKLSLKAAILFIYVHGFYKASLFMISGYIYKVTGTLELNKLSGLSRKMPYVFIIGSFALLSMAGIPPMLGFLGKELIYEAKVQSPGIASMVLVLGVISNFLMITVSLYFLFKVFLGTITDLPIKYYNKRVFYLAGPGILAMLGLLFGLFPYTLGNSIVEPALSHIFSGSVDVKLKIWHGFNKVFYLSLLTVFFGVSLFYLIVKHKLILQKLNKFNGKVFNIELTDVFTSTMTQFVDFSSKNTKRIQHGYHRFYLLTVLVFITLLLWLQVFLIRSWSFNSELTMYPLYISGVILVIIISTIYSALANSIIKAIMAMGVTGYGIALIYLYYSAIDLAITQILIETITVALFVFILPKLPSFAKLSSRLTRIRDLTIALTFGSVMTILALKASNVNLNHPVSDFFKEYSYELAHGKNIVNVILVDFRALDTLGEITVLTISAIGVFVLLKNSKTKKV